MQNWHELKTLLRTRSEPPQIWFRDDDATHNSQKLQNYLEIMRDTPLMLAVIADSFDESLAPVVQTHKNIVIAQHGAKHINHAPQEQKKSEYPQNRTHNEVKAEWLWGRERLQKHFAACYRPVFVPPWNRMHEKFVPLLIECRFSGLSCFGSPAQTEPPLMRYDTHIDIVNWQNEKKFITTQTAIENLAKLIGSGVSPMGLMTHHADHSPESDRFLLDLLSFLNDNEKLIKIIAPPFART